MEIVQVAGTVARDLAVTLCRWLNGCYFYTTATSPSLLRGGFSLPTGKTGMSKHKPHNFYFCCMAFVYTIQFIRSLIHGPAMASLGRSCKLRPAGKRYLPLKQPKKLLMLLKFLSIISWVKASIASLIKRQ